MHRPRLKVLINTVLRAIQRGPRKWLVYSRSVTPHEGLERPRVIGYGFGLIDFIGTTLVKVLGSLDLDAAKQRMRSKWLPKLERYDLSATDSYTDGFWDGRLWALARLADQGLVDFDKAVEALGVLENELNAIGTNDD